MPLVSHAEEEIPELKVCGQLRFGHSEVKMSFKSNHKVFDNVGMFTDPQNIKHNLRGRALLCTETLILTGFPPCIITLEGPSAS